MEGGLVVTSAGFYVLTECPSMFRTLQGVLDLCNDSDASQHVSRWLSEWWQTPFLISSLVLGQRKAHHVMPRPYFVNNRHPVQKVPLTSDDILTQMLGAEGYTVCNGLTLFLAMVRLQLIPPFIACHAIRRIIQQNNGVRELLALVPPSWTNIYLSHTTPHVSDYPYIYARMGDNPAPACVINLLCVPEATFIPEMGGDGVGAVTSVTSAILRFTPSEMYWPIVPAILDDDDDEYKPDIASFVIGTVRSRKNWKWWCSIDKHVVLSRMRAIAGDVNALLEQWLTPLAFLYATAKEHTPRLPYSRIRGMWMDVLKTYDPDGVSIPGVLRKMMVKDIVTEALVQSNMLVLGSSLRMPYALVKDIFDYYKERLGIWKVNSTIVFTNFDSGAVLRTVFPHATLNATGSVRLQQSLFAYFKNAPRRSVYRKFYKRYLESRMLSRLHGIEQGFGMKENLAPTLGVRKHVTEDNMALIGFLLKEHLRKNRDSLVF